MTVEELIKEINQEREIENNIKNFEKNIDIHMKYIKATYDAAINNGFTEEQAYSFVYAYYYNLMFDK